MCKNKKNKENNVSKSSVQSSSNPRMLVIITPSKSPGMQEHTVELLRWLNTYNKSK